jgi:hypothetical protein
MAYALMEYVVPLIRPLTVKEKEPVPDPILTLVSLVVGVPFPVR